MSRDLIGYGGRWPDLVWPNGERLAVSVAVNFEEGAEPQVLDGDPTSERIGEVISVVPEGRPDPGQAQIFAYGTRAGAWRMADALRRYAISATVFACGRAAERAAPVLAMLAADGHETACPSGLLVVPYALDANDMKFFHPNGFVRAAEMVEYVTDALDVLEAEAARGLPRLLNIGFHLRIVGRPGRFKAFEGVLAELDHRRHRLWIARRIEIADAFARASS